jgi:hypothetical protein
LMSCVKERNGTVSYVTVKRLLMMKMPQSSLFGRVSLSILCIMCITGPPDDIKAFENLMVSAAFGKTCLHFFNVPFRRLPLNPISPRQFTKASTRRQVYTPQSILLHTSASILHHDTAS